jgi:hypothetical protein
MQFNGARLKTEKGEIVADNLCGAITLPKRETENQWGGRFEFETVPEVMALLNRAEAYFKLEIPSVLNGKIILKNADGDFLGSGNPEMYA